MRHPFDCPNCGVHAIYHLGSETCGWRFSPTMGGWIEVLVRTEAAKEANEMDKFL